MSGSKNVYTYVGNDPTDKTDPTGEQAVVPCPPPVMACPVPMPPPPVPGTPDKSLGKKLWDWIKGSGSSDGSSNTPSAPDDGPMVQPTAPQVVPPTITISESRANKPREKAKDRRKRQREEQDRRRGGPPEDGHGTPAGNQRQNSAFNDATQGLTEEQRQQLHTEISGQNLDYNQIKALADAIKAGQ